MIRRTTGSPGSGFDLANIDTAPLPNGAQCFVTSTRKLYRFMKRSTAAAVAGVVIVPIAGGGRWLLESGAASGAFPLFAAATSSNTTNSSEDSEWLAPNTNEFAMQLGSGAWTFTALACVATYSGPPATYLARAVATVTFPSPDTVYLGVDHDVDLAGTAPGFAEGAEFIDSVISEGNVTVNISSERIVTVVSGDQIGPRFRLGGGVDLEIERLTLSAVPIA